MGEPATITAGRRAWHAVPVSEVVVGLEVDPAAGLSSGEAGRRLERYGQNRLADAPREPRWRAFLRQFQDLLILILLGAAVVSLVVSRDWETPVAIAAVVLLNAVIGFVQESKAEASLEALKRMLVTTATVRRDGRVVRLDATELVPGDVVVVEPTVSLAVRSTRSQDQMRLGYFTSGASWQASYQMAPPPQEGTLKLYTDKGKRQLYMENLNGEFYAVVEPDS